MIHALENTATPEVKKQAAASGSAPADTDFVATLHAAKKSSSKHASETTDAVRERVPVPDGETWSSTKVGAHFARIITGPRTGQYINLTHGDRRGQTFTIEHRDGKTLHVYKESGKEVTIKPAEDASATTEAAKHVKHPSSDRPARGERWAPVAGHNNYADILEGPRNGLYVNISGGIRDGMAFQIVKKGDKVFHVYGTGKDKQMIEVGAHKKAHHTAAAGAGGTVSGGSTASDDTSDAAASGTGGTAAPTT